MEESQVSQQRSRVPTWALLYYAYCCIFYAYLLDCWKMFWWYSHIYISFIMHVFKVFRNAVMYVHKHWHKTHHSQQMCSQAFCQHFFGVHCIWVMIRFSPSASQCQETCQFCNSSQQSDVPQLWLGSFWFITTLLHCSGIVLPIIFISYVNW